MLLSLLKLVKFKITAVRILGWVAYNVHTRFEVVQIDATEFFEILADCLFVAHSLFIEKKTLRQNSEKLANCFPILIIIKRKKLILKQS